MKGLKSSIDALINSQTSEWKLAHDNYDQLQRIKTRTVDVDGFSVRLQCNPERVRSCAARIDAKTIMERPCFLCNTPPEQQHVPYGNKFNILINPYPIFPDHLTIPLTQHKPQQIKLYLDEMLKLALDMPGWFVFYNGPLCGASAPDHMHFQAGKCEDFPLWKNLNLVREELVYESSSTSLYDLADYMSPVLMIRTSDITEANILFDQIYDLLPVPKDSYEPMMNLLAWKENREVNCCIFLRKALRPSCFYATNPEEHFMVSPATVEMAGLLILPHEEDYKRITPEDIKKIFIEVGYDKESKKKLIKALKQNL